MSVALRSYKKESSGGATCIKRSVQVPLIKKTEYTVFYFAANMFINFYRNVVRKYHNMQSK